MLLKILNRTDVPLLTTLHTVLDRPDTDQRRVLEAVIRRSARMIVMTEKGCEILRRVHGVPERLIEVIPRSGERPHGKGGVSTCRSRWSAVEVKKTTIQRKKKEK